MQTPKNTYIHIPFCKSKCYYCAFTSTVNLKLIDEYINALIKEIKYHYQNNILDTLYFGGGTPSVLPVEYVSRIYKLFNLNDDNEVTFELNPETVDLEYLKSLNNIGINRLSIGIQTFNEKILKLIGRKHTPNKAIETVEKAQNAGFKNISVDLIYGLPSQTIDDFITDLENVKNLDIQHVSLYGLQIEPNTLFYKKIPENIPDSDLQAEMHEYTAKILNNFEHYEISNYAKSSFYSKHNKAYWQNQTYYGFGCSAHGYQNGIRYSNTSNIHKYIENPYEHELEHIVTDKEKLEEEIFLGFRLSKGINVENINKKFNIDFESKYKDILKKYLNTEYLKQTKYGYCLTDKGFLLSNIILSEFL